MDRDKDTQQPQRTPNETAEREASTLRTEATPHQQGESNKTHGDKLEAIIPRDADQKGDR
jgi:hypothetical protein